MAATGAESHCYGRSTWRSIRHYGNPVEDLAHELAAQGKLWGPLQANMFGRDEPYDLGDGYNHMALTVEDIDATLATMAELGVEPEKPPFHPGGREELPRIAFVADPDGYRVELIDGGRFDTPQDPPHPSTQG